MPRLALLLLLFLSLAAAGCSGGGSTSAASTNASSPNPPGPPPPGPALDFTTSRVVGALSNPRSASALQTADLDGDGLVDAGMVSGQALALFMGGAQPYTTRRDYSAGPSPATLAFADLEGDGDPDALMANRAATGLVTVLRNRGDGTFDPGVSVRSGDDDCARLAAADFTGDGHLDVAAAGPNRITLLANDGAGALLPPVSIAAVGGAFGLAAAPRPGGAADLVVATNQLQLLQNDGSGTFAPGPIGPMPDNVQDVAVFGSTVVGVTDAVAQLFSLPGMVPAQTLQLDEANESAVAVTTADAENDGDVDLVVLQELAVNLFTQGSNGFSLAWTRAQGGNMFSVRAGDADGDGRADLALWDQVGLLGAALGTADGTFGLPGTWPLASNPGFAIANGNFGGTGPDLVTMQDGSANAWRNDGSGNFTAQPTVSLVDFTQGGNFLQVADLNRDRLLDLVTAGGRSQFAQASLATSPGNFQVASQFGNVEPGGLDVGDYDGDGFPDIALGDTQSDTLLLGQGNGDGTFTLLQDQSGSRGFGGSFQWLESGDFTGDTLVDLALMMANGDVWGLRGQASFDFLGDIEPTPTGGRFFSLFPLAGGDLPDLYWCGNGAFGIDPSNGGSTISPFQDTPDLAWPLGPIAASAVGDFDGDGNPDLAMVSNGAVGVLTGNGDGTFSDPAAMPVWFAGAAVGIVPGDYNRDGKLDLAAVGSSSLVLLLHR